MALEADVLKVYLEEYRALMDEINARFESQRLAFNLTILTIGALLAALSGKDRIQPEWMPPLLIAVPFFIVPMACIFFDNELLIWGIIRHINGDLGDAVRQLTGSQLPLSMESRRFRSTEIRIAHQALSYGRWVLFLVAPVIAVVGAWDIERQHALYPAYTALLAAGTALTAAMFWPIYLAVKEQRTTWHLMRENAAAAKARDSLF